MKYFDLSFNSVFIMLGSDCNAKCAYCLQQGERKERQLPRDINDDIIYFIDELARRYTKSQSKINENNRGYFYVTYFGGEPLLYWDKIKYINKKLLEAGCLFRSSIITNGILLDEEKINYLNKHNFNVVISWDGNNTKQTRLFDVLNTNKNNILSLNNLTLNAILTKYSYPTDILDGIAKVNEEYIKLHDHDVSCNIETFIDTGCCNQSELDTMDAQKLYQDVYDITTKYLNNEYADTAYDRIFYQYAMHMINTLKERTINNADVHRGNCSCGWKALNMDLKGNFYTCHNSTSYIGNIYNNLNDYFVNLAIADTRKHVLDCNNCDVKYLCHGGCKMVSEDLEDKYCNVQRNYYIGFYQALIDWNNKIDKEMN